MYNVNDRLTTPYEEGMDKDIPWNIYPRPALRRDSFICLNGRWDFAITAEEVAPRSYNEKILVPYPPESPLSGIGRTPGKYEYLHYRRTFSIPKGFIKKKVYLRFGAVDRLATVSVNGKLVGTHNDGYLPFYADITDCIKQGENEVHVRVRDNTSTIFPYGKQRKKRGGMWYTPTSGIWQTVWLESVPENYIESLRITPTSKEVRIELVGGVGHKKLTLTDSGEEIMFDGRCVVIRPKEPKCWTPETPYLYNFKIETKDDCIESYFALREVGICDTGATKRLTLNGKPYLFNGLLDQGYYPDGIFLPATPEGYKDDILTAKRLGFNTLRKHIKLEPAIFYYYCDKYGIAVFQDMINNSDYSFIRDTAIPTVLTKKHKDKNLHRDPLSREAFLHLMHGVANTLYNYPSVLYYTVFNEGWGQFCADDVYDELCEIDHTRIIDATSGWFWQKKSDVYSHHVYFKSLLGTKSPADRPAVISEFGGLSHRVDGHVFSKKNYGYGNRETAEELTESLVSLYTDEVIPMIKDGASAFIYTQVSDVEDETNGLITYDRRVVKVDERAVSSCMESVYAAFYESVKEDV